MRKFLLIVLDVLLCTIAAYLSMYMIFGAHTTWDSQNFFAWLIVAIVVIIIVNMLYRLYDSLWEYASVKEMLRVIAACITANLMLLLLGRFFNANIAYRLHVLFAMMSTLCILAIRSSYRIARYFKWEYRGTRGERGPRIVIIGAGEVANLAITQIKRNPSLGHVVALVDDNRSKQGSYLQGINIVGGSEDIIDICAQYDADEIILAVPNADKKTMRSLLEKCKLTNCRLKTIPNMPDILSGKVHTTSIRDVQVEDLLGRSEVGLDMTAIAGYIRGQTVMVTGGGGSIGSELCRQIARFNPAQLIILDFYENSTYELELELKRDFPGLNIAVVIASVCNTRSMDRTFALYRPDIVFHAAAHKHVPLMEDNPAEAVLNNVFGTLSVARTSDSYGVKRFVLISTDKAVNPTSVMGATKRVAEMIICAINERSATEFAAVRFGNVLGSNGSVVPLFKRQIEIGGPVTITHRDITRYFMTIREAAQLVLQAGALAGGGEVFVLDMGEPVRIDDLARDLIRLSGLEPDRDIEIVYTGLRPGEKMFEELLDKREILKDTPHEKIFVGKTTLRSYKDLMAQLKALEDLLPEGQERIVAYMQDMIPEYTADTRHKVALR